MKSTTYHLRGGGNVRLQSPWFNIIYVFIVITAILGIAYFVYNTINTFINSGGSTTPLTLTPAQTRQAIDSNLPILSAILDDEFSAVVQSYKDRGASVFQDDRYNPEGYDLSAPREGLIFMPVVVDDSFMDAFYQASYTAYSVAELESSFNGAWVLNMERGALGSHFKIRYVNLNGISIEDEMNHLREFQGLGGEDSLIAAQGTDTRGNTVMQGTKIIGETTYYWKIAACPFNAVYSTNWLPDNAVYISCTVATFDFYTGGDVIRPPQ